MATIQSFEELEIWKKAQNLGVMVFELSEANLKIAKDYSFKDQIKRASLSISNNIAEGFEYSNNNDFYRFLRISKGSCGEVRNCLLFSERVKYTTGDEVEQMIDYSRSLAKQIGSMMRYLMRNKTAKTTNNKNP
ncbi:MAG TPA: four helix bundle protein [Ferruginibacter sp.]|nr:four helix bundle protein [Ferruginibacter sp.]HMP20621.1 four helix bundle protein [Ferruginibacter sp.]